MKNIKIALMAISALAATSTHAAEFTWRMQSVAAAGTSEYKMLVENFANRVKDATDGQLEIKIFPAGALMSSAQAVDAVSKGVLDVAHTYLVYHSGKEPALKAVNEWHAESDPYQGVNWYYKADGQKMLNEILTRHRIHHLGVSLVTGEQIWSKEPIKSVDDLKGIKIRAAGLAADGFSALGASVVSLPGEEVYQGLQRGIVDAAEFTTMAVNYGIGLHEVAKYVAVPSYSGGGTADTVVSYRAWEKLPAELKVKVEAAFRSAADEYAVFALKEEKEVREKLIAAGVTFVEWSEEDVAKMAKARLDVMTNKYAKDSETYAKKLASQIKFLESSKPAAK